MFSAATLSRMEKFERFQTLDDDSTWLHNNDRPFILLFVSHRWDSYEHPDPSRQQIEALQTYTRQIPIVIRALFSEREKRLKLVPDLKTEGMLQAEEIARRIMGYGPFSDDLPRWENLSPKQEIENHVRTLDPESFDQWMLERIGLWVDYCSVPQHPRNATDQALFDRTLSRLDKLLPFVTVVGLRRKGDDYSDRAWCVSEILLGAKKSFNKSLYLDIERAIDDSSVAVPGRPSTASGSLSILQEGYDQDYQAFQDSVLRWENEDQPLNYLPPDVWSAYRSLQGSATQRMDSDPNPGRRGIDLIRDISTDIIRQWWMSETLTTIDLTRMLEQRSEHLGLLTTDRSDQTYLGLLLAKNGWIAELQPFFSECLNRFLQKRETLKVELQPVTPALRSVLKSIRPSSPDVWSSRLSYQSGHSPEEKAAIAFMHRELSENPLSWKFI